MLIIGFVYMWLKAIISIVMEFREKKLLIFIFYLFNNCFDRNVTIGKVIWRLTQQAWTFINPPLCFFFVVKRTKIFPSKKSTNELFIYIFHSINYEKSMNQTIISHIFIGICGTHNYTKKRIVERIVYQKHMFFHHSQNIMIMIQYLINCMMRSL